jgi:hypothetical protein
MMMVTAAYSPVRAFRPALMDHFPPLVEARLTVDTVTMMYVHMCAPVHTTLRAEARQIVSP